MRTVDQRMPAWCGSLPRDSGIPSDQQHASGTVGQIVVPNGVFRFHQMAKRRGASVSALALPFRKGLLSLLVLIPILLALARCSCGGVNSQKGPCEPYIYGGIVNIDSHHAATYVVTRLAGFSHHDAEIVAHASEYVDDATNDGMIQFDNSASYHRICSAPDARHRNVESVRSARVWVPFHFLPGNGGLPEGQDPPGGLVDKLICRKDSPIARAMIRTAITERNKPYGLHRLGIAAHVYTDTWAHQDYRNHSPGERRK